MSTAQILLIEDDEILRQEMSQSFTRASHRVKDCGTLAEASQLLANDQPDVVVCDIKLPDGDGLDFSFRHAPLDRDRKWLLMSGDARRVAQSRDLVRKAHTPPFSVLEKPVPLRLLLEFVRLAMMQRAGC